MDATGFDTLTRSLTGERSRRGALASLLAGTLGLSGLLQTEARKKRKKKKKPCPPCKKRKKGKCKGKLPDGTACPGGTCQTGACVAIPCAEACAAGCCNVAGACLPGDAADDCGASGRACQNCADQGQLCIDGQCQLQQQSCLQVPCDQCQQCNNTGTKCEAASSENGKPCSGVTCDEGEEGICSDGQCTCHPKPPTCVSSACPPCHRCNNTGTACEAARVYDGQPCSGVTCESGTVGVCVSGECQCKPVQTCADELCDECWACNDTDSGCVIDLSVAGLLCYSVTCEVGEMALCTDGQCQCQ